MNLESKDFSITPTIRIVEEYVKETGNTFHNFKALEEVEKFAIWVVCNYIPLDKE